MPVIYEVTTQIETIYKVKKCWHTITVSNLKSLELSDTFNILNSMESMITFKIFDK